MKPPKTLYACLNTDAKDPWEARKSPQECGFYGKLGNCAKCSNAAAYDLRETKGKAKK